MTLSVFLPAYNEQENISQTVLSALKVLKESRIKEFEIIVVDDASTDGTAQIVKELIKKDGRIRLISHQQNLGYGGALKTGFSNSRYEWVAFIDSDGQFDFSEIAQFLKKTDTADVILGYRLNRADPFRRKVLTLGWKMLAQILLGLKVKDYSCGFKLIKRQVFEDVLPLVSEEKVTQIEFLVKAQKKGFKFAEVGVHHFPRRFGTPTGGSIFSKIFFKSIIDLLKLFWQVSSQVEIVLFGLLLALTIFLRFYNLEGYMNFLGDEGRDALMIKRILTTFDLPLIGPPMSVGNIYLGPLYYYMMTVPMTIFWLNPVAAAGLVALLGSITVVLIYYLTKQFFGIKAALASAFLYSISPITIIHSHSSWNPNPAPFFTLLIVLSLLKAYTSSNYRFLVIAGALFAAALQMHYLALILLPPILLFWIFLLINKKIKNFWWGTFGGIGAFFLVMSPLIIFDIKHGYLNFKAFQEIFLNKDSAISLSFINPLARVYPILFDKLLSRFIAGNNPLLVPAILTLLVSPLFLLIKRKKVFPIIFMLGWLFIGIFTLSFYKQDVYDHYLGFVAPAAYILIGSSFAIESILQRPWRTIFLGLLFLILTATTVANFLASPLRNPPPNQLKRTQRIAKFIIDQTDSKPFNFSLIAERNYDSAYQFYLDIYKHSPKRLPDDITDQLFVVCEDQICLPVGHPKYEIAAFGWTKIGAQYNIDGVKIFKLVRNQDGKP